MSKTLKPASRHNARLSKTGTLPPSGRQSKIFVDVDTLIFSLLLVFVSALYYMQIDKIRLFTIIKPCKKSHPVQNPVIIIFVILCEFYTIFSLFWFFYGYFPDLY